MVMNVNEKRLMHALKNGFVKINSGVLRVTRKGKEAGYSKPAGTRSTQGVRKNPDPRTASVKRAAQYDRLHALTRRPKRKAPLYTGKIIIHLQHNNKMNLFIVIGTNKSSSKIMEAKVGVARLSLKYRKLPVIGTFSADYRQMSLYYDKYS